MSVYPEGDRRRAQTKPSKSAHSSVRSPQPFGLGGNRASHRPGIRDVIHQNFHRPGPAAKLLQRLEHLRLHCQAGFGVAIEHPLDSIKRGVIDAIDEGYVEVLAGGNVVDRDHFRHFQEVKRDKMGVLQESPALVEGEDRDGPLDPEDLCHLLFRDSADVPQPFPQAAAAQVFLCFQRLLELLIIHKTAREHEQPERNSMRLGRWRRRPGQELPDGGNEGLTEAIGAAIPAPIE